MTKKINNLDVGIVDEMGCDRLFQLKNLPAVLLLTVEARRTLSMHRVGIVLGFSPPRTSAAGVWAARFSVPAGAICRSGMLGAERDQVDALGPGTVGIGRGRSLQLLQGNLNCGGWHQSRPIGAPVAHKSSSRGGLRNIGDLRPDCFIQFVPCLRSRLEHAPRRS
jgi:hypothetical protein